MAEGGKRERGEFAVFGGMIPGFFGFSGIFDTRLAFGLILTAPGGSAAAIRRRRFRARGALPPGTP